MTNLGAPYGREKLADQILKFGLLIFEFGLLIPRSEFQHLIVFDGSFSGINPKSIYQRYDLD